MARYASDVLRILRLLLNRRNENDPDSSDTTLMQYINDFISLSMTDELKVFEQFGTMSITIDGTTDGVYTFPDASTSLLFSNLSTEVQISLLSPVGESVSWNFLTLYQDPGIFFGYWGINNEDVLVRGYPSDVLYYGNQLTFRTIPQDDTQYMVRWYGYQINPEFTDADSEVPFDHWVRYLAYGAGVNYALDYNYDVGQISAIKAGYALEKTRLLTRTHNQIRHQRAKPRF